MEGEEEWMLYSLSMQRLAARRAGVSSRLCGFVVVAVELSLFVAPFSIVAYMPKVRSEA